MSRNLYDDLSDRALVLEITRSVHCGDLENHILIMREMLDDRRRNANDVCQRCWKCNGEVLSGSEGMSNGIAGSSGAVVQAQDTGGKIVPQGRCWTEGPAGAKGHVHIQETKQAGQEAVIETMGSTPKANKSPFTAYSLFADYKAGITKKWEALSSDRRAEWNERADRKPCTGYHLFVSSFDLTDQWNAMGETEREPFVKLVDEAISIGRESAAIEKEADDKALAVSIYSKGSGDIVNVSVETINLASARFILQEAPSFPFLFDILNVGIPELFSPHVELTSAQNVSVRRLLCRTFHHKRFSMSSPSDVIGQLVRVKKDAAGFYSVVVCSLVDGVKTFPVGVKPVFHFTGNVISIVGEGMAVYFTGDVVSYVDVAHDIFFSLPVETFVV